MNAPCGAAIRGRLLVDTVGIGGGGGVGGGDGRRCGGGVARAAGAERGIGHRGQGRVGGGSVWACRRRVAHGARRRAARSRTWGGVAIGAPMGRNRHRRGRLLYLRIRGGRVGRPIAASRRRGEKRDSDPEHKQATGETAKPMRHDEIHRSLKGVQRIEQSRTEVGSRGRLVVRPAERLKAPRSPSTSSADVVPTQRIRNRTRKYNRNRIFPKGNSLIRRRRGWQIPVPANRRAGRFRFRRIGGCGSCEATTGPARRRRGRWWRAGWQ